MTRPLILASSSPRRRELLASLGVVFRVAEPDIDETQWDGEAPLDYVHRLSRQKAEYVAKQLTTPAAILAADTTVILAADTIGIEADGTVLGKPLNAADARRMLRRLRGRAHRVCTGVTLLIAGQPDAGPHPTYTELVCTEVHMRRYTDDEIERYIATGDPFDKAGSYAIQHAGFQPVERIVGCYTNVVGLPLCAVRRALAFAGWPDVEAPAACDCPYPAPNGTKIPQTSG